MKTYAIAAIPGDGIGTEVVAAGVEVLAAIAKRDGGFAFKVRSLRLGRRVLQEARPHDAGERPRSDPQARRDPVRLGRASGDSRPHHALGPAPRHLPAVRPVRQCAPDPRAAGDHVAAAQRERQRARLGHRARELRGRIRRRRRPGASGLAAGSRDGRGDVHARRRRTDHALCVPPGAVAAAQTADRRHQVQRATSRHGDVGRDRGRDRRPSSRTSPGTRCWSTP